MKAWTIREDVVWTLRKGPRTAEARTRAASSAGGSGQPELCIYTATHERATLDLMWSQVMKDHRAARAMAEEKKKEFEAEGFVGPPWPDD